MSSENILKELKEAFKSLDEKKTAEITQKAVNAGMDPLDILEKNLLAWLKESTSNTLLSVEYKDADKISHVDDGISLSELIMYGECLNTAVNVLRPVMAKSLQKSSNSGRIILGTVEGDVHDIGKSIIGSLWAAAGYEIVDLGYDVPCKTMVKQAKLDDGDVIGVSCSLGMARLSMKQVVDELKNQGIRDKVMVISGGQASFPSDVETYGVDANAADVSEAMSKIQELTRIVREKKNKK
jgi:methylmalonyl-CoA mutase cobalamin-binding domain/chain